MFVYSQLYHAKLNNKEQKQEKYKNIIFIKKRQKLYFYSYTIFANYKSYKYKKEILNILVLYDKYYQNRFALKHKIFNTPK